MGSVLEDVHLDRHLRALQRKVEAHAVLGNDAGIRVGMKEERRRRLRCDPKIVREILYQLWVRVLTEKISNRPAMSNRRVERDDRVSENQEVRPAADAID